MAKIRLIWAYTLKHHYPRVIGHVQLAQAHEEFLFGTSNSYVVQKLSELWLLTYSSYKEQHGMAQNQPKTLSVMFSSIYLLYRSSLCLYKVQ